MTVSFGDWRKTFPAIREHGKLDDSICPSSISHRPSMVEDNGVLVIFKPQQGIDLGQTSKASLCVTSEYIPELQIPQWIYGEQLKSVAEHWSYEIHRLAIESLTYVGVTGTNGKSTVVHLFRQLLELMGDHKHDELETSSVASLGTLGVQWKNGFLPSPNTTPFPLDLYPMLGKLRDEGIQTLAMEVSSHALNQKRVHKIPFKCVAFTSLGRDHLDYHGSLKDYGKCKWELSQLCNGSIYANDNDSFFGPKARSIHGELFGSENPKRDIGLRTQHLESSPEGMSFQLLSGDKEMGIHHLSFWGVHNLDNTLAALSLCMGLGHTLDELLPHLAQLQLPKGRLQEVSCRQQGKVYIDYAHTPDALQAVLKSVRTHCPKANIRLLFGCGGNRDKDKRKEMGRIASQWADALILTSDNPRYEDPKSILKDIEQGVKQNTNYDMIPDRREAILWALSSQSENDILLLCGKGHETEQSLGETSLPFDEFEICQNY